MAYHSLLQVLRPLLPSFIFAPNFILEYGTTKAVEALFPYLRSQTYVPCALERISFHHLYFLG